MALVYADRVSETTTTTGTGTYDLAGAATGFQSFVLGIGTGNTCKYSITDGTDWEVGEGTVTDAATDTLSRDRILDSSNAGAAVNWSAGEKGVFVTLPAEDVRLTSGTRNNALNQDPISQGVSTRTGMSSTKYTGNGGTQSITTGIDMSTQWGATADETFGGFVWLKNRDAADSHILTDTFRTAGETLVSDTTAAEVTDADTITAFTSTGFSLGADVKVNTNTEAYIAWSFQTTHKTTGTTNRNKAYTAHYNDQLGFSVVGYEGDGIDGHEIPHHLPIREGDDWLLMVKNRDDAADWSVASSVFDSASGEFLVLNTTNALSTTASLSVRVSDTTITLGSGNGINGAADNIIFYLYVGIEGISKVGKYIGTGVTGNFIDCNFGSKKAGFVRVKALTSVGNWAMVDTSLRTGFGLFSNIAGSEVASEYLKGVSGGFSTVINSSDTNTLNKEYVFVAFAESSNDGTISKTDNEYPTTGDTITVEQDTVLSFAQGFNSIGEVNGTEQVPTGTTFQIPASNEDKKLWLYKDFEGSYAVTDSRPLEGYSSRDDADRYGLAAPLDATLRTTAKHLDYEASTGVVLASGEVSTFEAFNAFDKDENQISSAWRVATTTTSNLQYKGTEARILKSWRLRSSSDADTIPRRFTIQGSDDGFTWTAIDSTYTSADFTDPGVNVFSALQSTSGNTTAYLYHRINITANHGDATNTDIAEFELNTILSSDYYLVQDGKLYNASDVAIERVYLAEIQMNASNEVASFKNLPVAKGKFGDVEVHGVLKVRGDLLHIGVASGYINFKADVTPARVNSSVGVKSLVILAAGTFRLYLNDDIDGRLVTGAGASEFDGVNLAAHQLAIFNQQKNYIDIVCKFAAAASAGIVSRPFNSFMFYGGKV